MAKGRKSAVVPSTKDNAMSEDQTVTQDVTQEETAPQDGANATPAEQDAGHILDLLHDNADAIRAALEEADTLSRGDTAGTAFTRAKVAIDHLDLTHDVFARWKPDSGDAIDRAIAEVHNTIRPNAGPAVAAMKSAALLLAVCATDADKATAARVGNGSDAQPQFNFVRKRTFPGEKSTDERTKGVNKQEEAKPRLLKLAKDAQDAEEKRIWQDAANAINDVDKLRRLANDLSATTMDKSRWRKWLYVPLITDHLDAFVTQNEGNKTLGQVWVKALSAAQQAHASVMKTARDKGQDASADDLRAAVEKSVWTDYLEPQTKLGRVIKEKSVNVADMTDKFFAAAEKLGQELNVDIVDAIVKAFSAPVYKTIGDGEIFEFLGQRPKDRKKNATVEKRQNEEAAEQGKQAQAQDNANVAATAAREQRAAQRTAQQTGQAASGSAAAPQRRAVDPNKTSARLAALKK